MKKILLATIAVLVIVTSANAASKPKTWGFNISAPTHCTMSHTCIISCKGTLKEQVENEILFLESDTDTSSDMICPIWKENNKKVLEHCAIGDFCQITGLASWDDRLPDTGPDFERIDSAAKY